MSEHDTRATEAAEKTISPIVLFAHFLKLGLTSFGGPAMVAYIRELAVTTKRWVSEESFRDGVALCQSIPGATAMQTAAYTGLRAGGFPGALAAYVGFGLPAFVLMLVLSVVYREARDLAAVVSAFRGLQVIVVALIAHATISFGQSALKNWRDGLLALGAAIYLSVHGSPVIAIIAAAVLGVVLLYRHDEPATQNWPARAPVGVWRRMLPGAVVALFVLAGLAALFVLHGKLFDLAAIMLKVDILAFGGGYASVPLMLHEVVEARNWMDSKTFMDGIALGQVTPGPIVITATFVGFQVAGVLGALVATVAVFSLSFVVLAATVPYFDHLRQSALFRRAVRGALVTFVALLLAVAVRFGTAVDWTIPLALLAGTAFAALRLKIDILWVVVSGAVLSVLAL